MSLHTLEDQHPSSNGKFTGSAGAMNLASWNQSGSVASWGKQREGGQGPRLAGLQAKHQGRGLEAKFKSWDSIPGAVGGHCRVMSGEHHDLI